jgi:hypothetical protein
MRQALLRPAYTISGRSFSLPRSPAGTQVPDTCPLIRLVACLFLAQGHVLHATHVTNQAFKLH